VTVPGTLAADGLLLDTETLAPPDGAADERVTVPPSDAPPTTLEAPKATDESVGDGTGAGC